MNFIQKGWLGITLLKLLKYLPGINQTELNKIYPRGHLPGVN